MKYLVALVLTLLLGFGGSAFAKDKADVFDIAHPDGAFSIDKLTCGQFLDLVNKHDPSSFQVVIWLHGMESGVSNKMVPFNEQFVAGTIYVVEQGCGDKAKPITTALIDGERDLLASGVKPDGQNAKPAGTVPAIPDMPAP